MNSIECCEVCLKFAKETKNPQVRKAVIGLFPRFAGKIFYLHQLIHTAFSPKDFVNNYLNISVAFLLGILKKPGDIDRPKAFVALGEVAMVANLSHSFLNS